MKKVLLLKLLFLSCYADFSFERCELIKLFLLYVQDYKQFGKKTTRCNEQWDEFQVDTYSDSMYNEDCNNTVSKPVDPLHFPQIFFEKEESENNFITPVPGETCEFKPWSTTIPSDPRQFPQIFGRPPAGEGLKKLSEIIDEMRKNNVTSGTI